MLAPGSCSQAGPVPAFIILSAPGVIPRHFCKGPEAMTTSTATGAGAEVDVGGLLDAAGCRDSCGDAAAAPLGLLPQSASKAQVMQKINATAKPFIEILRLPASIHRSESPAL